MRVAVIEVLQQRRPTQPSLTKLAMQRRQPADTGGATARDFATATLSVQVNMASRCSPAKLDRRLEDHLS
jgi:hypothetical protein